MRKYAVIGILAVVVMGAIWLAVANYTGVVGGFSTQRIVIQGRQIEVYASQTELGQTFSLIAPTQYQPPTGDGQAQALPAERPMTFVNPAGCTCFLLDSDTRLPTGIFDCSQGQQAPLGKLFSAYCPTPNSEFYLTR